MQFRDIHNPDCAQQPLHLDEGRVFEYEGQIFHSRGFISFLRPVGGPRFVDILTLDTAGKWLVETVKIEEGEVLMMSANVWHAGKPAVVQGTQQGKLWFAYYDQRGMPIIPPATADESPFAVSLYDYELKKVVVDNLFPFYRLERNGDQTQAYHYWGNEGKYETPTDSRPIAAKFIAAEI